MLMPAARRLAAGLLQDGFGVSQRRACDALGVARSTVRYVSHRGDDPIRDPGSAGGWPAAVGLPPAAHPAPARRLALQPQTRVPPLSRGTARRPPPEAAQARGRRPHRPRDADAAERALVDGLHGRHLGRRPHLPHVEHRRRREPGMPGDRGRPRTVWPPGDPRPRPLGDPAAASSAHCRRQRARVYQHRPGRLGVPPQRRAPLHPAWQARGQRLHRVLHENWFVDLEDARTKIEAWRIDYNQVRPRSALGNRTPAEYTAKVGLAAE